MEDAKKQRLQQIGCPERQTFLCLMHGDAAEDQFLAERGEDDRADDHQNGDLIVETCRLKQGFVCIHPVRKERRDKAHDIGCQILCARHQHDDACDCSGMKRLTQNGAVIAAIPAVVPQTEHGDRHGIVD